jgi:hypothetical protein
MILRIAAVLGASALGLLSASCCCTSEPEAPGLRPLPQFREIPAAPMPEPTPIVEPTK